MRAGTRSSHKSSCIVRPLSRCGPAGRSKHKRVQNVRVSWKPHEHKPECKQPRCRPSLFISACECPTRSCPAGLRFQLEAPGPSERVRERSPTHLVPKGLGQSGCCATARGSERSEVLNMFRLPTFTACSAAVHTSRPRPRRQITFVPLAVALTCLAPSRMGPRLARKQPRRMLMLAA